jgi:hypothetical protein
MTKKKKRGMRRLGDVFEKFERKMYLLANKNIRRSS